MHPIKNQIQNGDFAQEPASAIKIDTYYQWLGYAFERFCRKHHKVIAKMLGFSAVRYRTGTYFNKSSSAESPGYQIDLLFERDDRVITVCEVKYTQAPVDVSIIEEVERKLALFKPKGDYSYHKVLIAPNGANRALKDRPYFDKVITLEDFFKEI